MTPMSSECSPIDKSKFGSSGSARPARHAPFNIPLYFEANQGQFLKNYDYLTRAGGMIIFLAPQESLVSVSGTIQEGLPKDRYQVRRRIRIRVEGADEEATARGERKLQGKVNYFVGSRDKWKTNIPTFGRVRYSQVLPGVDLVYYAQGRNLEYDFIVAPGSDPSDIKLSFEGHKSLRLDGSGNLVISTESGNLVKKKSFIYQEVGGERKEIQGGFKLLAGNRLSFRVGVYDRSKPLVLDPVILYSTYLGGPEGTSEGTAIAVDGSGAMYVTGKTFADDFPTQGAIDPAISGITDAFVTKINPDGDAIVYSTYLGGSSADAGHDICLDSLGAAYVVGTTSSIDFPLVGAIDATYGGTSDGFAVKINPAGNAIVYSTYLGGAGQENRLSNAVDTFGAMYITGETRSADFPTSLGAFDTVHGGNLRFDAFATKINPAGNDFEYSTFLGDGDGDGGRGIAVDSAGSAYVTGYTNSAAFPVLNPLDNTLDGFSDAFVTKLNPTGTGLVYSTFLGGGDEDAGLDIALDSENAAYVTGSTRSVDFPTTAGVPAPARVGGDDAFVTKINPAGDALGYSTFLGGSDEDYAYGIAVDPSGSCYLTGRTKSADFMLADPLDETLSGIQDAYTAKINPAGTRLEFSTYLGGSDIDYGSGVAVDNASNVYLTGYTNSADFPTKDPLLNQQSNSDAFVTKIATGANNPPGNGPTPDDFPTGGPAHLFGGGGPNIGPPVFANGTLTANGAGGTPQGLSMALAYTGGEPATAAHLVTREIQIPGLIFRRTGPDGEVDESWLPLGHSGTMPCGVEYETVLRWNYDVRIIDLDCNWPQEIIANLTPGSHRLTYWLQTAEGKRSNCRFQRLVCGQGDDTTLATLTNRAVLPRNETELAFRLQVSMFNEETGFVERVKEGMCEVEVDGETWDTFPIVEGMLTAKIPFGQTSLIKFIAQEFKGYKRVRIEFRDGFMYAYDHDFRDATVEVYQCLDGESYAIEYYRDLVYICNQGEDPDGPILGRMFGR